MLRVPTSKGHDYHPDCSFVRPLFALSSRESGSRWIRLYQPVSWHAHMSQISLITLDTCVPCAACNLRTVDSRRVVYPSLYVTPQRRVHLGCDDEIISPAETKRGRRFGRFGDFDGGHLYCCCGRCATLSARIF